MTTSPPLPVTLLTGFLGSGKTTLVNRILRGGHGRKIGVIVNEFGAIGIDAALIDNAAESVLELANGCLCCATQGDLRRALRDIARNRARLDALLIETSGLADPEPVIAELQRLSVSGAFRLDGVVTLLDAENFDQNLEYAEAAHQQIAHGDILVLNKVDLVDAGTPRLIEDAVRNLNRHAAFLHTVRGDAPLDALFDVGRAAQTSPFICSSPQPSGLGNSRHNHRDLFDSVSLTVKGPLDPLLFTKWLDAMPASVIRAKGFVRFSGETRPVALHVVGARRSVEAAPDDVDVDGAELVVIGRELAADRLRDGLKACRS